MDAIWQYEWDHLQNLIGHPITVIKQGLMKTGQKLFA